MGDLTQAERRLLKRCVNCGNPWRANDLLCHRCRKAWVNNEDARFRARGQAGLRAKKTEARLEVS